ncbi:MAG: hypothetical protein ACM3X3_09885 [Betaproteobacteria bacterium]
MRKLVSLSLLLILVLPLSMGGCLGRRSPEVSTFRIIDVKYRKTPLPTGNTTAKTGPVVNGRFIITYEPDDATSVVFHWALGRQDPSQPWHEAGSDPDLDG